MQFNKKPLNHADISILRSQHHICGLVTGTLPHLSQQNAFLGIPLVLMPEEVVLLVEKGTFQSYKEFHLINNV
jgi:hypothetical protein